MDISKLKRNGEAVVSSLMEVDEQLITKTGCDIYFPAGYVSKGLAVLGNEVSVLGIFAYVVGDNYAVSLKTSTMLLVPANTELVTIDEASYYKLSFVAGSVVVKNTMLVKNKKLINYVMDYYYDFAKMPWFINYLDHAEILSDSQIVNGVRLADNITPFDIVTAHISRDPANYKIQYRHVLKSTADLYKQPLVIPSRDIANNTTSNLARINGSEINLALRAALTSEPTRSEPLEEMFIK